MRKNFYKYLTSLFKSDERITILLGDIGVFSLKAAFDHDPSRAYNLGIMEHNNDWRGVWSFKERVYSLYSFYRPIYNGKKL